MKLAACMTDSPWFESYMRKGKLLEDEARVRVATFATEFVGQALKPANKELLQRALAHHNVFYNALEDFEARGGRWMDGVAYPTLDEVERGLVALIPFHQAWGLPLNPEDLELMVGAVLRHGLGDLPGQAVQDDVRLWIEEHAAANARMYQAMRKSGLAEGE